MRKWKNKAEISAALQTLDIRGPYLEPLLNIFADFPREYFQSAVSLSRCVFLSEIHFRLCNICKL